MLQRSNAGKKKQGAGAAAAARRRTAWLRALRGAALQCGSELSVTLSVAAQLRACSAKLFVEQHSSELFSELPGEAPELGEALRGAGPSSKFFVELRGNAALSSSWSFPEKLQSSEKLLPGKLREELSGEALPREKLLLGRSSWSLLRCNK
ncbi:unnamed protein product [Sphagnum tenellum]